MKTLSFIFAALSLGLTSCSITKTVNYNFGNVQNYNLNTEKQDRNKALQNAYLQNSINQDALFTFTYVDDNGEIQITTITEKHRQNICARFALSVILNK